MQRDAVTVDAEAGSSSGCGCQATRCPLLHEWSSGSRAWEVASDIQSVVQTVAAAVATTRKQSAHATIFHHSMAEQAGDRHESQ